METKQRRPAQKPAGQGRPVRKRRRADAEVVYTPAQHFDKYKFLLRLATVVAVVLALTLGMAIFFKVEVVNVAGAEKYSAWQILEASGIQVASEDGPGENLLTLNKFRAGGRIKTALPYVDEVKVSIKLPDTVNIEITELKVVYAIGDSQGGWWLMDAHGTIVDETTQLAAETYTRIQGVQIQVPEIGQSAVGYEPEPAAPETTGEETSETAAEESLAPTLAQPPVTVYAAEKLSMAITVLQALENSQVFGNITQVDVSDIYDLQIWYEDRYQVLFGDSSRLDYKIEAMKNAAGQMTDYQRGKLDVSFTQWPDKVGYTPFEE